MRITALSLVISSFLLTETFALCESNTSCRDCLGGGCDWSEVGCIESCDLIADVSCYSFEYFEGMTVDEICTVADNDKADGELCYSQTDCSSCVGSVMSDGVNTCMWFEDGLEEGFCASRCGMWGCGEITCSSDTTYSALSNTPPTGTFDECSAKTSCQDCLDSSCDWSEAGCLPSCDMIADVSCYNFQYFGNMTSNEICTVADNNKADSDLCGSQTDCTSCVGSVLSDGASTCQWFKEGFCASGCGMIGCGETTCSSEGEEALSGIANNVLEAIDAVEESATGITSSASGLVNQAVNQVLGTESPTLSPTIYVAPETQVDKVVGQITDTVNTVAEASGNVLNEVYNP